MFWFVLHYRLNPKAEGGSFAAAVQEVPRYCDRIGEMVHCRFAS